MEIEQFGWSPDAGWPTGLAQRTHGITLCFCFGSVSALETAVPLLGELMAGAVVVGCSTAGDIVGDRVYDDRMWVTGIRFARPCRTVGASVLLASVGGDSRRAGLALAASLRAAAPHHVIVFGAGRAINGSHLVTGLHEGLPPGVAVSGGIAGDGPRFGRTVVVAGGTVCDEAVTAIGICGPHVAVGCGYHGGWQPFGPERLVTRSAGNVLYELDGKPALALYERYLGDHAADLPASGLRFPLAVRVGDRESVVRTLLGVDRIADALVFAGEVQEGSRARFMTASSDAIVAAATLAARRAIVGAGCAPDLALLVSCVGRRLVLGQRAEEEVEAIQSVFGADTAIAGFYSYGEICPGLQGDASDLHNQTMTITTLTEGV